MLRPKSELVVDTSAAAHQDLRASATPSTPSMCTSSSTPSIKLAPPVQNAYVPPRPSIRLLYSFLTTSDLLVYILPAVATSVALGGVAPFMTIVLGQAFNEFSNFPSTTTHTDQDQQSLKKDVGSASLALFLLGIASLALTSVMSMLWICTGERNVMRLRKRVYEAVTSRDMEWFDMKLGGDVDINDGTEGKVGPAGLMATFSKDTDNVRQASSLAMGQIIQYAVTVVASLILAFKASWSLTLVILASVPVTVFIQAISQIFAGPLLERERGCHASASGVISRAVSSIATVKAYNSVQYESASLGVHLRSLHTVTVKLAWLWGLSTAATQFSVLSMFILGFWFGSHLIEKGQLTFGEVVSVFWACLIASSNFQMAIPHLITLTRGKWAMVSLMTLIDPPPSELPHPHTSRSSLFIPLSPGSHQRTFLPLARRGSAPAIKFRKIRPPGKPMGEIVLRNVTFSYPSRPDRAAVSNVSMFIPAKETTFIVGPSGSGKSTIAQLLLRMYEPASGTIDFDNQSLEFLDEEFTKEHVAAVAQGCVLFDMNVHENVAMGLAGVPGRSPEDATRDEIIDACRIALIHEFVRDLPDGYETQLGTKGASLSGGQKQRIAIARAKMRDPTVLILDEATSALDPVTRHLVFSAVRTWRKGKTTLVITHDLRLIDEADFVYVMKDGEIAEQGYRGDLELVNTSLWKDMTKLSDTIQSPVAYGWAPEVQIDTASEIDAVIAETEQDNIEKRARHASKHASILAPALRPSGQWMFDAIADLTRPSAVLPDVTNENDGTLRVAAKDSPHHSSAMRSGRPSSIAIPSIAFPEAVARDSHHWDRRSSLQFTPSLPHFVIEDDKAFELEKSAVTLSGVSASHQREARPKRIRWDEPRVEIKVENTPRLFKKASSSAVTPERSASLLEVGRLLWHTVPNKGMVFLGLGVALISGAMTPIFSFLFSRLLVTVASVGTKGMSEITTIAAVTLVVAFFDGLFAGLKFFIMEVAGFKWINSLRIKSFPAILLQDKKWFDKTINSSERLVHTIIKDGEDAQVLIVTVLTQSVLVISMISVGFIWALIQGWQLTLAGLAIGPVFAVLMIIQARLMSYFELQGKREREEVSRCYHDAITNIREIRSMSFERVFKAQYNDAVDRAQASGQRGAIVEGGTVGMASALIYFAEALLFYVGAVLIARGDYTYLQMMEVLNLVAFTVTIASQLMAFVERIAKAVQAAHDFSRVVDLRTDTDESHGSLQPAIRGTISFSDVTFAYPERPDAPVLRGLNMQIVEGEAVAVVGASGSGKSTIAALLQRLYEPSSGSITIGGASLSETDVLYLRDHIAVVSQTPHLFDATVSQNISYGTKTLSVREIAEAAVGAGIHDFITGLPKGYETSIGENAVLLSGGQAQRVQIARALARHARILILDECTSALDTDSESMVLNTIRQDKGTRTTLMITHKQSVMRKCDRIVVMRDGEMVEQGSYDELMARRKAFYMLATAGEWN